MKYVKLISCLLVLFLSACEVETTDPHILDKYEVLYANNFEDSTDLQDLQLNGAKLVNFAAPDSGEYSLDIEPQWFPDEGYLIKDFPITLDNVEHVLTFYSKIKDGPGQVLLTRILDHDSEEILYEGMLNQTEWDELNISFTPDFNPGDFLRLKISAGSTEVATWHIYVDNLKLLKKI